ncbi:bifunctional 4-hydroxy-2-oxoglutarate aldolase/2-dehydro-3-deoxy-phosphogluconate aldolase [Pseudolysinimonas sp.]|uniref:bifunctional 4-hydroxy-2-oxoglutarate aldolase/2-dehydro-3-deoxy-phosphogluconate aldolase n=1 Tax=Pseudolysinimonas sp. TaxID=2680009 RepID=UPI003F7DB54F
MNLTTQLGEIGVLPVVVLDDAADAPDLARALRDGGVDCAEITLRTSAGLVAIEAVAGAGLLVGAGTVLDAAQVRSTVDAGARFVVSPGWSAEVVAACRKHGVLPVPGVATATEVMTATAAGLRTLKLFPAAQLGGPAAIAALHGPFPDIRFVPSGGIGLDEAPAYAIEPVLCVSTSWIAPRDLIREHRFAEIAERAATFRAAVGR